jgi:2-oxoisovalerate dehydrogenase E1 component alpha subunit
MDLPKEVLLEMYWRMLLARRIDERAWELHSQGKITFHISGIGHEAAQVGIAYAIDRMEDWVVPYERDLALMLALGLTPQEYFLGLMGKRDDPASGGRQLPNHWSFRRAHVVSNSAAVAAQTSHAVGIGLAIKQRGETRVVLTTCGEGATSMGTWYEAVNWAAIHKLPVVFVVENNMYAISLRQEKQMAVGSVAEKAKGLGLPGITVDGTDLLAVHRVTKRAVERARQGSGPTLVETKAYRVPPHSSDDDDRHYREKEEVDSYRKRDPLLLARTYLETEDMLPPSSNARMETRALEIIDEAVQFAIEAPNPAPEDGAFPVYVEEIPSG